MKKSIIIIAIIAVIVVIGGLIGYNLKETPKETISLGSVSQANEYHYKTFTSSVVGDEVLKTTPGTLGSAVINLIGTAPLTIYDATTTNVSLRALATSSLPVIAYFPASQAVGTYTYDVQSLYGLVAVWGTGTIASTTLTWR